MHISFIAPLLFMALLAPLSAPAAVPVSPATSEDAMMPDAISEEDALNLYCLRQAYPALHSLETDSDGRQWLIFTDGRRALYRNALQTAGASVPTVAGEVDVSSSMAMPYPLEPKRPPTPPGVAPGRLRPYDLLAVLYGNDRKGVSAGLRAVTWQGRPVRLSAPAAEALKRVSLRLEAILATRPDLRPHLASEGGFVWRRIAGEDRLSPHAFGIALDLNAKRAPYWRWSHTRPHPRQQDYPGEIVASFEEEGFIWGGKWHEYDLMHFEYRPELICKARLREKIPPHP